MMTLDIYIYVYYSYLQQVQQSLLKYLKPWKGSDKIMENLKYFKQNIFDSIFDMIYLICLSQIHPTYILKELDLLHGLARTRFNISFQPYPHLSFNFIHSHPLHMRVWFVISILPLLTNTIPLLPRNCRNNRFLNTDLVEPTSTSANRQILIEKLGLPEELASTEVAKAAEDKSEDVNSWATTCSRPIATTSEPCQNTCLASSKSTHKHPPLLKCSSPWLVIGDPFEAWAPSVHLQQQWLLRLDQKSWECLFSSFESHFILQDGILQRVLVYTHLHMGNENLLKLLLPSPTYQH